MMCVTLCRQGHNDFQAANYFGAFGNPNMTTKLHRYSLHPNSETCLNNFLYIFFAVFHNSLRFVRLNIYFIKCNTHWCFFYLIFSVFPFHK